MQSFQKNITTPSGTTSMLSLLIAAGYPGTAGTREYSRKVESVAVALGPSTMAALTDGRAMVPGDETTSRGFDLSREYVYDPAGGSVLSISVLYA